MSEFELKNVDFGKNNGLVPAIIQDEVTQKVLMLGYMNQEALDKTLKEKKVTFSAEPKTDFGPKGRPPAIFVFEKYRP